MIAGATPPPKQTRKNGTTPDTTGTAKMSGLQSKKKSSNDSNNNREDEVDGEDIYSVPKEDQNINNEDHAGTAVPMDMMPANYEEDFPRLDKPEGKVSNIQTTTIKDTKVNQQESPEAIEADGEMLIKSGISTKLQETTHPQPHEDGSVITKEKATNVSGDNKATPPTSKATKKVQIQQTLPVVLKRKFEYRVLVSFKVKNNNKKNMSLEFKADALKKALLGVLAAGQQIVSDFAINSWRAKDKVNTIQKAADIPDTVDQLSKYWKGPVKLQPGKLNWYCGIKVTSRINLNQFIQYWKEKIPKARSNEPTNFHPIRPAPFQSEAWFEIGWFAGTTEFQYLKEQETGLSKETGSNIKLEWGNIVFPGIKQFWDLARKKQKETKSPAEYRKLSPKAVIVMTDAVEGRINTIQTLYTKFGRLTPSGEWPVLPDGSRLRYTPPSQNVRDYAGQKSLMQRMSLHIEFKWRYYTCPTRIIDPSAMVEEHGKSIGHLALSIMKPGEKIEEPYFRHFLIGQSYQENKWELVVHQHLFAESSKLSDKLEEEMEKRFGIDKTKYFKEDLQESSYAHAAAAQLLEFTLDDKEDMYMSGKTQFQFHGIRDVVDKNNKNKTVQEMVKENDASIAVDKESQQSPGEEEEDPSRAVTAGPR